MHNKIILDLNRSDRLLKAAQIGVSGAALDQGICDTLLSMVLFDEAEITVASTAGRELALERLKNEGLAKPVPPTTFVGATRLAEDYLSNLSSNKSELLTTAIAQERSIEAIWPLIVENHANLKPIAFDKACDLLLSRATLYAPPLESESMPTWEYGLPTETAYKIDRDILEDLILGGGFPTYAKKELRIIDEVNKFVPTIIVKYIEMRGLIARAAATGAPIASNFGSKRYKPDLTLGQDAVQLCRVHLNEVRCMPYLETLDDVLRLRGNPYIANFREAIFEWLSRIAAGEADVEAKYRAQIRLANEELKKLDRWKVLDSPYTLAASIAVGAAELFTGTFFGFGFAAASAAAMIQKGRNAHKYGYALFRPS